MIRTGISHQARRQSAQTRRSWTVLAVLFTLFVELLAPFSQALAHESTSDTEFQIICSVGGFKQIRLDGDAEPVEDHHVAPCPFCFLHAAPVLLDLGVDISVDVVSDTEVVTFVPVLETTHTSIWRSAPNPSRAPPLSV